MKTKKYFLLFCFLPLISSAQFGLDEGKTINTLDDTEVLTPESRSSEKIQFKYRPKKEKEEETDIGFIKELEEPLINKKNLLVKGENNNLPLKVFRRDQSLGDIIIKGSNKVIIGYRDYEVVDGDVIRIIINDKPLADVVLTGKLKGIPIELEEGFNKIDFLAVNMGQYLPNTAEFVILDKDRSIIKRGAWQLATGFKATMLIVKQ